jgi:hypothetical protein
MEILTIKIECVFGRYLNEESAIICDIQSAYPLKRLCNFILASFEFDNDHLHEFFVSRRPLRSQKMVIDDESIRLKDIFPLEKNNCLFMNFDFGDDWIFKISRLRQKAKILEGIPSYPRIIEQLGKIPQQYLLCEE